MNVREVKQKVWSKAENGERDWKETLKIRFCFLSHHTGVWGTWTTLNRFWEKKKKRLFCSLRYGVPQLLETLRSRVFSISREKEASRSHVTSALLAGLRFEVYVCTARSCSRGKWVTARVFALQNITIWVWEKILLFRTLSLINYWTIFHRKVTLKTISQLK